jgi:hypothetical protein
VLEGLDGASARSVGSLHGSSKLCHLRQVRCVVRPRRVGCVSRHFLFCLEGQKRDKKTQMLFFPGGVDLVAGGTLV